MFGKIKNLYALSCLIFVIIANALAILASCQSQPAPRAPLSQMPHWGDSLVWIFDAISNPPPPVQPSDWLFYNKEEGQNFEQYIAINPVSRSALRKQIYIQTFGAFDSLREVILHKTAQYLQIFYDLPIRHSAPQILDTNAIPTHAYRTKNEMLQIKTGYLLNRLSKALPDSAIMLVGFTDVDLYPSEQWNYVFGQASLYRRVGVWSLARFGNPYEDSATFRLCLKRTIQTAVHEVGHAFSLKHCIAYDCTMAGSNNLREIDSRPLHFCPICEAKISYNLKFNLHRRYLALAKFWKDEGFHEEAQYFTEAAKLSQQYGLTTTALEE
ncbi:MAG: hypothetical protein JJT94_11130 [Bernardetiaceae bacterium]|nr:hypothetical protein [Bernardetiaceae bacterium]